MFVLFPGQPFVLVPDPPAHLMWASYEGDQLRVSTRQLLTSFPNLFLLLYSVVEKVSCGMQEAVSALYLLRSLGAVSKSCRCWLLELPWVPPQHFMWCLVFSGFGTSCSIYIRVLPN